ncbi:biosynthetic-type acetolactate synthase large subunit [Buchnera aphidicola (Chaitoregma tattakana)]|uniref:biosynthetic-type acetolactate synthase large subunit n=1 Tax=Buchnera aphidicola TaxID=9 RepID=UPI0031B85D46
MLGADIVVNALIEQKTEYIFGYPGGAVLDIYDSIKRIGKIKHILVRHEQAATHMADGYARATGKIGVVLVTSGPGATNAITGIATAYMDSIPMIIISGQVDSSLIGYDAFQECDMIGISRPIVKHSFLIKNTIEIPEIFKKSFYISSNGRKGPVVIDIPKNILSNNIKRKTINIYKKNNITEKKPKNIDIEKIKKISKEIMHSKRPMVFVGGGAVSSGCSKHLLILLEKFNFPVTTSLMGLGLISGRHVQCLGMLGMHGTYEANMAMHNSDIILAIGVRFDDRTTNNINKYCPYSKIIHIDIDPTSISKTVRSNISVIGDAKKIIKKIIKILQKKRYKNNIKKWWQKIQSWRKINSLKYENVSTKIKPQYVIETLWKVTRGNAYITSDVGQHQMFTALHYSFEHPRDWINSGGLGTMGFGFPAALGVKLAFPERNVICITGDGSIQMNIQELSTAKQYNIPILIISLNNSVLGMVKQWQDINYSSRYSQSYMKSLPNFSKLAKSYGHIGIEIFKKKELYKTIKYALEKTKLKKLVFLDIKIDSSEHVYPMQIKGQGMNKMILEKKTEKL